MNMPKIAVNGTQLYYTDSGNTDAETIVFSHGFLFSHQMYEAQIAHLQDRYRCVAYDHRGQGESDVQKTGYDIDSITNDAVAFIKALDLAPCHFVGLSMGGFVGLRLAIQHPELLRALILIDSSSEAEPFFKHFQYRMLAVIAQLVGTSPVVDRIMKIMFGKTYLADSNRAEERKHWRDHLASLNVTGVTRALEGAAGRGSVYESLNRINLPTLILVGEEDVALPMEKSRRMHEQIPDSQLIVIPNAGHSPTIENPTAINQALDPFLGTLGHD